VALDLAFQQRGAGPPVLILHGLFGSAGNWTGVARALGERFEVFALDLRNHGASPWDSRMDYPTMAEDVAQFVVARNLGHAAVIGHSLGGKVAMTLALSAPDLVERLVVVDIAPAPRPPTHLAYVEAMQALDLGATARRVTADALLKPRIPDDAERGFLLQNLLFAGDRPHWRINLDAIAAGMDDMAGFPDFTTPYRGPVLAIRGGASPYVPDRDLPAFARLFPAYRLVTIPGAGHWLHAERAAEFLAAVMPFLAGGSN
jgi:pimeloyl-ACP methyl ester carboxylesterase